MIGPLRRLRARWKYRHFEHDLVEEIDAHRALAEAEALAAGENRADARKLAARQLGNVTLARENARRVWIGRWVEEAWQDLRYAVTCFRRQPRFALGVVAMLGLATGFLIALGGAVIARRFLFGLSPFDPIAYLQAAAILVLAGVAATWVPVRRATRVDPVMALRVE